MALEKRQWKRAFDLCVGSLSLPCVCQPKLEPFVCPFLATAPTLSVLGNCTHIVRSWQLHPHCPFLALQKPKAPRSEAEWCPHPYLIMFYVLFFAFCLFSYAYFYKENVFCLCGFSFVFCMFYFSLFNVE